MNYIVLLCDIVVSMYDFGFCNEIFGSIPAGGVYFSAPIWHYFSMSGLTVSLSGLYICLMSFSILHKFKKSI